MQKIIHYFYDDVDIWHKGKAHSVFRICYASWVRHCSDYELKLWHPEMSEFQQMLHDSYFLRECYNRKIWALVADYVRYYALYHFGGIYLDTDVQLLENFDKYLNKPFFISIEGDIIDGENVPEPAVMGGEKGHQLFKDMLDIYNSEQILKIEYFIANIVMSNYLKNKIGFKMIEYPANLQQKAKAFYDDYNNKKITDFELYRNQEVFKDDKLNVEIYPSEYFCPTWDSFGFRAFTENTVAIHWNQSSWWKDYNQLRDLETLRYKEWYKRVWYRQSTRIANFITCMIPNKTLRRKARKYIKEKIRFK
ncbi:MAG: hypothetical protein E7015_03290 [Alphaproteobacteria bacterium]|nr:hypothetical protein [Alphaproteobacteria bacterium]